MTVRLKPVQPRSGDILEVVSEAPCTNMKVVLREGRVWALKFFYANGAVLYVPLPSQPDVPGDLMEVSATTGAARS